MNYKTRLWFRESPLDAQEIRDRFGGHPDLIEQLETILAQFLLLGTVGNVDGHLLEESVDVRTELRHRTHRGFVVLSLDGSGCFLPDGVDRPCQRLFLLLAIARLIRSIDISTPVLLLLDADDIGRALVAGQQILSVLGVEEFSKGLDAVGDRNNTCLADMNNGVHKIVPRSFVAQLHFEPLLKKVLKAIPCLCDFSVGQVWPKPPDMHRKQ